MTSLTNIDQVRVARDALNATYNCLRRAGAEGHEAVALWAGSAYQSEFRVTGAIIPEQHAIESSSGLGYFVDAAELHRINVFLHEQQLVPVAQIHSHPGPAYHSDTDDAYPIIATIGGFSIVVPDFARGAPSLSQWAVFRLEETGWRMLEAAEVHRMIRLEVA